MPGSASIPDHVASSSIENPIYSRVALQCSKTGRCPKVTGDVDIMLRFAAS
ncbi:hypothetical protein RHECNPAF_12600129 [Rhizobium etli CNPAF512]|nr:hypothetical protein RHECNPAF_12600129 [Rhizobium etli CNPAF512]